MRGVGGGEKDHECRFRYVHSEAGELSVFSSGDLHRSDDDFVLGVEVRAEWEG